MKKSILGLALALCLLVAMLWAQAIPAQAAPVLGVELGTIVPNGPAIQDGVLGAGDQAVVANYRFTVTGPVKATLSYSTSGTAGTAMIRTLTGDVIDDNSAPTSDAYGNAVSAHLLPGTYYATVSVGGTSVSYKIQLKTVSIASDAEQEPNDSIDQAVGITWNQQVKAVLCGFKDADVFKFTAPGGMVSVRVSMPDGAVVNYMRLYNADGELLSSERLAGKTTSATLHTLAAGEHYLRFEADAGDTGRYLFTVGAGIAAQSVSVSPNPAQIAMGGSGRFDVTTQPAVTDEAIASVVSSDESIATVRDIAASSFSVNAIAMGNCTVTVTMSGGKQVAVPVTVASPPLESISLPEAATLTVGFDYSPMPFTFAPSNAAKPAVSWSSSNTGVLTVAADGVLSALKVGSATLTATAPGDIKASCTVTVGKNEYKAGKPAKEDDDPYIISSAKRIYYKGKYIYFEIYLVNYTPYKISPKGTWRMAVYDFEVSEEKPIYNKKIKWNFGTIKKGGHKVFKTKLPKKNFAGRDLGSGQLWAGVVGGVKARNITSSKGMLGDVRMPRRTLTIHPRGLNRVGRAMQMDESYGMP